MPTIGNPCEGLNDFLMDDFSKKEVKGGGSPNQYEFCHFGQYVQDVGGLDKEFPETVFASKVLGFAENGKEIFKVYKKVDQYILQSFATYLIFGHRYFGNKPPNENNILRSNYNLFNKAAHKSSWSYRLLKSLNLITFFMGSQVNRSAVFAKQNITKLPKLAILNANNILRHLNNGKMNDTNKSVVNRVQAMWANLVYQNLILQYAPIKMVLYSLENRITCKSLNTRECYAPIADLGKRLKEIGLKK